MSTSKKSDSVATLKVEPDPATNPDPITGAPGSHPVGTAVGSASGAGAGALAGALVAGPIGAVVGAVAGAVVGAAGGHAVGEAVDPSIERDYWHVNYMTRPYYKQGRSFGDYESAYQYGWENATMPGEMTFEEAESARLSGGWMAARGDSTYAWEDVREATRDAWTRARRKPTV